MDSSIDAELAGRLAECLERAIRSLGEATTILVPDPPRDSEQFAAKRAIAGAIAEVHLEVLRPLYERYPHLKPEGL